MGIRYIDATSLRQKWLFRGKDGKPYRDEIDAMPAADVIEVVRCKDCEHYDGVHGAMGHAPCLFWGIGGVMWNDYCRRAERGEDECY